MQEDPNYREVAIIELDEIVECSKRMNSKKPSSLITKIINAICLAFKKIYDMIVDRKYKSEPAIKG